MARNKEICVHDKDPYENKEIIIEIHRDKH